MPLLALCAALSACGQTGPLYLPDQVPESEKSPSQRNKERAQGKQNPQPSAPVSTDSSSESSTEPAPTNVETTDAPAAP